MYLKQNDIFWNINKAFIKKVMEITTRETRSEGEYLFHRGDPATYFYILLKGRVDLLLGESGKVVHVVNHAGEAFGWSSLVGRETYSASAFCTKATTLLSLSRKNFQSIVVKSPVSGLNFYKRLAAQLGNRLIQSYDAIEAAAYAEAGEAFGTGQVQGFAVT